MLLEVEEVTPVPSGALVLSGPSQGFVLARGRAAAVFMRPDGSNLNHELRRVPSSDTAARTSVATLTVEVRDLPQIDVPVGTRVFVARSAVQPSP